MSDRILVVKGPGGGGLGDRIRAALVGCLYADLAGRAVFVDWTDGVYANPGTNAFDQMFIIRHVLPAGCPPYDGAVRPAAWQGRTASTMDAVWNEDGNTNWNRADAIQRYSFDLSRIDYEEDVLVMWEFDQLPVLRMHLHDDLAALPVEALLARLYRKYLQPVGNLRDVAQERLPVGIPSIGVHVRATAESRAQKGTIPMSHFYRAIDRIRDRIGKCSLFIATDNASIENDLLARYPDSWSHRKWFATPGDSLHLNRDCPDLSRLGLEAITDILTLARCDYLISVENSSFSIIARLMSDAPEGNRVTLSPPRSPADRVKARLRGLLFRLPSTP